MPTPGFKQVDKGGPVVYDIAGDGSLGYCYGVGVINSPTTGGAVATGAAATGNPVLVGLRDVSGNAQFIAGDASGNQFVTGNVASGVTDSGNPVKTGGVAATAPGSATAGQRKDLWVDLKGATVIRLTDANGTLTGAGAVGTGPSSLDNTNYNAVNLPAGGAIPQLCNSQAANATTFDRQRNNTEVAVLASAARTTTAQGTSADQVNYNGRRLLLVVDVSVVGTGSITPSLQVKDSISGNYFTVWTAAAAIVTGATFAYYFADGAGAGGTFTEKLPFGLPSRTWRVVCTHNNANSITYSVSGVVGL